SAGCSCNAASKSSTFSISCFGVASCWLSLCGVPPDNDWKRLENVAAPSTGAPVLAAPVSDVDFNAGVEIGPIVVIGFTLFQPRPLLKRGRISYSPTHQRNSVPELSFLPGTC